MNSKITASMMGLLLIVIIIIAWPKQKKVHLAPDVEAAINSIEPIREVIPADVNEASREITLGSWGRSCVQAFPRQEWDDGHISRNRLKKKEVVLKKADGSVLKIK